MINVILIPQHTQHAFTLKNQPRAPTCLFFKTVVSNGLPKPSKAMPWDPGFVLFFAAPSLRIWFGYLSYHAPSGEHSALQEAEEAIACSTTSWS